MLSPIIPFINTFLSTLPPLLDGFAPDFDFYAIFIRTWLRDLVEISGVLGKYMDHLIKRFRSTGSASIKPCYIGLFKHHGTCYQCVLSMSAALTVHAAKVNIYNHNSTNHHKNSHNVTDTTTIASNNDHSARHRERISITDSSCVRWDKGLGHDDLLASQSHSYLDLFNPDTHTHHVAASMQPVDNHLAPPLKPYEQSASSHSPATPTPSTISTGGRTWKSIPAPGPSPLPQP